MTTVAKKSTDVSVTQTILSGIGQSPLYPLNFVKVLMQIGHEPLPVFKSKNLFGRETLYYPNSFSYLRYIYKMEGITGLYRGLGMKIISNSVGNIVYNKVSQIMDDNEAENPTKSKNESSLTVFIRGTSKELTGRCWAIVVSHPFHVMALRCMAQFVGGESNYSSWNVFSNSVEIYKSEGIAGFFSGLIPRLLFEASTIAIANTIAYLIKTYVFEEKDIDGLIDLVASLLANSVTYPLSVVSTVCSISGSQLVAGQPPKMLVYASWIDAFKHLYEMNELKRGASTIFRVYVPPTQAVSRQLQQKALRSSL